ncbi:MAG: hypothetical protein AB1941_09095 [Gemmatimonadota bacterium]
MRAYEEVADFIAAVASPEEVVAFRASEAARWRLSELLDRQKDGRLSADEASELDCALTVEHLMRLAKARALPHVASQDPD